MWHTGSKKDTYLKAYAFVINLVKGRAFWPTSEERPLQPPLIKKKCPIYQPRKGGESHYRVKAKEKQNYQGKA